MRGQELAAAAELVVDEELDPEPDDPDELEDELPESDDEDAFASDLLPESEEADSDLPESGPEPLTEPARLSVR